MANNKFTFYESYLQMLEPLSTAEEKLELLMSVIKYALYDETPNIQGALLSAFLATKPNIDNDLKRREINRLNRLVKTEIRNCNEIKQKITNDNEMERNITNDNEQKQTLTDARAQEKEREIEIEKDNDKEFEREKEAKLFSLSQEFKKAFPNKNSEYELTQNSDIDINKLIRAIKQSEFLLSANNLDFKWCCNHYSEIIANKYKDFKPKDPSVLHNREYTKEEYESLIRDFDDVEF